MAAKHITMHNEFEENPTRVSQPSAGAGRANSAGLTGETTPFDDMANRANQARAQINASKPSTGGVYVSPAAPLPPEQPTRAGAGAWNDDHTQVIKPQVELQSVGFVFCKRGTRRGQLVRLSEDRTEFGRASDCALIVEDRAASAHHGTVRFDGSDWRITDFDSTNGTRVNGQKLGSESPNPHILSDGDVITIGETDYVFKCIDLREPIAAAR